MISYDDFYVSFVLAGNQSNKAASEEGNLCSQSSIIADSCDL